MNHNLRRVLVVGTSGSGKTTFAQRLADNLQGVDSVGDVAAYPRCRREFAALRRENVFPNLAWLEFNSPRQAEEFLRSVC